MAESPITEQEVRHAAQLSRLKLSDEKVRAFTVQMAQVLGYIEKLNELDVTGVEPMAHPNDACNRLRDDEPGATLSPEQALANAPASDPPYFRVPKVLGDGGGA